MAIQPPLSLYLHLPWCIQKCPYCDFNSHAAPSAERLLPLREQYVAALQQDLALQAPRVAGRRIVSVFIGGGTPSLFTPAQIGTILDSARRLLDFETDIEITMEANPGTLEHGSFSGYREAGVNRLSIGGQSFDAAILSRLGRLHGPDETRTAVARARAAGFERINVDLMYGLPGQTVQGAVDDVASALALDITHISHYQLTLEPNTRFHAAPPQLPGEDEIDAMLAATDALFSEHGFRRYEVSALGKGGHHCAHNLNYWRFGDYLAVGAGAHGKLSVDGGIYRYSRPAHPRSYIAAIESATDLPLAPIPRTQLGFEFMLNAARLVDGFSLSDFEARTGLARATLRATLHSARARGLVFSADDEFWQPTALGLRFNNELQMLFLPD